MYLFIKIHKLTHHSNYTSSDSIFKFHNSEIFFTQIVMKVKAISV
jgi:hypothetical protein